MLLQDEPRASLDVLSQPLLERVLALAAPAARCQEELLGLRLVSRRWDRAMLSAAVWRHRELNVGRSPGLLRRLTAVDRVTGSFHYGTPARLKAALEALADSPCAVSRISI